MIMLPETNSRGDTSKDSNIKDNVSRSAHSLVANLRKETGLTSRNQSRSTVGETLECAAVRARNRKVRGLLLTLHVPGKRTSGPHPSVADPRVT